jgi:hypothetical protein
VGWDSPLTLTGTYELGTGDLYVFRLPMLSHDATLYSFGAYGTATPGVTAEMALYADDGSGAAPGAILAQTLMDIGLAAGPRQQPPMPMLLKLNASTYYWLGIEVSATTYLISAFDEYAVGWSYTVPYGSFPPVWTNGFKHPNLDLGIFIYELDSD